MSLSSAACGSTASVERDKAARAHLADVRVEALPPEPLGRAIQLYPQRADQVKFFRGYAPSPLPKTALPTLQFLDAPLLVGSQNIFRPDEEGLLRGRLVLLSTTRSVFEVRLVCLVNGRQVGCASRADVWEAMLDGSAMHRFPIEIPVRDGDRVDLVRLVEGDEGRPYPFSSSFVAFARRVTLPRPSGTMRHDRVFAGCDLAGLAPKDSRLDTFAPPGHQTASSMLHVIVEFCDTRNTDRSVQLVPIANRSNVVAFHTELWKGPVRVPGRTFAARVPTPLPDSIDQLQVYVMVHARSGQRSFVTQGVTFRRAR